MIDESVPVKHAHELFERAGDVKDLVIVDDSPHCFWVGKHNQHVQELTLDWLQRYL